MLPWPAARIGDPLAAIDTPALLLDLDAFEQNLARMQAAVAGSGVRLRPHAKSHKCPEIARRQVALGAVGICCQKVSEAAPFVDAGIADILITNEIASPSKAAQAARLARRARIGILADHALQVALLGAAAAAEGVVLDVYVEVDIGGGRCGVLPGDAAAQLAQTIAGTKALRFAGLHCYHGSAQHLRAPEERAAAIAHAAAMARISRDAIEAAGLKVEIVTGAGTGTFVHERDSAIYNELQAGSYIFMDRDYADNVRGAQDIAFAHSLFVLCAVMSRPDGTRAVVDAGLKASSVDSGLPVVWQRPDLQYSRVSDEHGVLVTRDAASPALGDRLLLVPGHCDPTVNLYDELICIRGSIVEAIWPVAARGALL